MRTASGSIRKHLPQMVSWLSCSRLNVRRQRGLMQGTRSDTVYPLPRLRIVGEAEKAVADLDEREFAAGADLHHRGVRDVLERFVEPPLPPAVDDLLVQLLAGAEAGQDGVELHARSPHMMRLP
ncbi:hypothetical protein MES4922_210084 [Mesorhizobium ventifaucium]|uniref:Uncharacterized protein n=1 Tax=Mesorhizobium ventifaucium TaxID=666020 RepID=A0ABN8JT76_9HYPH|nr:hypothetical protein MES4922_210084 [Mesorhizobium ventifaucium]